MKNPLEAEATSTHSAPRKPLNDRRPVLRLPRRVEATVNAQSFVDIQMIATVVQFAADVDSSTAEK